MEYITIYLSTCDKTSYILPATIYLYKKYINTLIPKFKVLGFSKPNLPDWENVDFIELSNEPQNISKWSWYLYNYFKNIDEENIFLVLDDFFPINYLNKNAYEFVINFMKQNKQVGFCTVGQTPSACPQRNEYDSTIAEDDNMFIYKRKKNINYQITLQPGIWNREYLCIFFNNYFTPWQMELNATPIANNLNTFYNIGSNKDLNYTKCIMPYSTQSSLSSKWNGISVLGLKHEVVLELINNNLIPSENLLIGAWNNYIKFNPNHKISDTEFISLCKDSEFEEWNKLYLNYYK
tara:strand:+ start:2597 stop:3475 length:879 start_codon:yes stop_codon:yes gene_type:complete